MPVREFTPARPGEYNDLVNDLAAEWKNPSPNGEPEILLERDRDRRVVHVYVVWGRWAGVDRALRSEIVMDAAAKVLPPDEVLNIIVAMGLTPEEAVRSGIVGVISNSSSDRSP